MGDSCRVLAWLSLPRGSAPDTRLHRPPCVLRGGTRDVKAPLRPPQTISSRPFEPRAPSHSHCSVHCRGAPSPGQCEHRTGVHLVRTRPAVLGAGPRAPIHERQVSSLDKSPLVLCPEGEGSLLVKKGLLSQRRKFTTHFLREQQERKHPPAVTRSPVPGE